MESGEIFARQMKKFMDENGIRAVDIAEKSGTAQSLISLYLNGKKNPKYSTIEKIAGLYGLNPGWLIGQDVPMYAKERYETIVGKNVDILMKLETLSESDKEQVLWLIDRLRVK